MFLRMLGMMGRGAINTGAAVGGAAVGAAGAVGSMAMAAGYLGYRAVKGPGAMHHGLSKGFQMKAGAQARLAGAALLGGAAYGGYTRDPGFRASYSPGGNLEAKSPAMLDATGDLALSLNRNARNVPSPTQYGYMVTTSHGPGIRNRR